MNACNDLRRLLPLISEDDLSAGEAALVSAHLRECAGCRMEDEKYRSMIVSARSIYATENGLPAAIHQRIAAEAAERVSRPVWPWSQLALIPRRLPAFVTAMAALLILLAGLPLALRHRGQRASGGVGIAGKTVSSDDREMQIEVVADGDSVKLAWSDGDRQSYTVYKTDDPRAGKYQEAHLVNGNVWVDSDPQSSPVVFYKIE